MCSSKWHRAECDADDRSSVAEDIEDDDHDARSCRDTLLAFFTAFAGTPCLDGNDAVATAAAAADDDDATRR
jgi:hypothetical protein